MNAEQIHTALQIRETGESIAKVREAIKEKFDIDVPQSTMQKALTKHKGSTLEEIEAYLKTVKVRGPRKDNTTTTTKSKSYSQQVIYLGNKALDRLTKMTEEAVQDTEMIVPVTTPTVNLRELADTVREVEKYVADRVQKAKMPCDIEDPTKEGEQLEIPSNEKMNEIEKPFTNTLPEKETVEPQTPKEPTPPQTDSFTEREDIERRVHNQYGYGDEPIQIAMDLAISIDEVKEILNLNQQPEDHTPENTEPVVAPF